MVKKIGILTFHNASNFGAVLQTYALNKSVKKFFKDVEVIDYKAKFIRDFYNPYHMRGNKLRAVARILVHSSQQKKCNYIFSDFGRNYYDLSVNNATNQTDLQALLSSYETIICGSDQIWNLDLTKGDNSYFLPFQLKGTKKASYAGSFGNYDFQNSEDDNLNFLNDFKFGSCREEGSTQDLNKMLDLSFECHVDPTLLLNRSEWNKLACKKRVIDDPYVLIYTVNQPSILENEAISYAKERGYRIVQIKNRGKVKNIEYLINQSPQQFLSLFRDAESVYTNSFHGTVFSLIFEKQFLVELQARNGKENTRAKDLLEKLELTERFLIKSCNVMDEIIDWKNVKNRITFEQKRGMDYLKNVVE